MGWFDVHEDAQGPAAMLRGLFARTAFQDVRTFAENPLLRYDNRLSLLRSTLLTDTLKGAKGYGVGHSNTPDSGEFYLLLLFGLGSSSDSVRSRSAEAVLNGSAALALT